MPGSFFHIAYFLTKQKQKELCILLKLYKVLIENTIFFCTYTIFAKNNTKTTKNSPKSKSQRLPRRQELT